MELQRKVQDQGIVCSSARAEAAEVRCSDLPLLAAVMVVVVAAAAVAVVVVARRRRR